MAKARCEEKGPWRRQAGSRTMDWTLGGVVYGERKQKQPVLWKEASVGKSDHLAHKDRQGSGNVLRRVSGQ